MAEAGRIISEIALYCYAFIGWLVTLKWVFQRATRGSNRSALAQQAKGEGGDRD